MVAAAALAVVFGARVDEEEVFLGLEHARNGGEEGRPAGAGLVLHLGEERQVAARAGKDAGRFSALSGLVPARSVDSSRSTL